MKYKDETCNRCGKCCFLKTYLSDIAVFTDVCCSHYNRETKLCNCYNTRFKQKIKCLSVSEAIENKALPNDCPYVKNIKGYNGPVTIDEAMEILKKRLANNEPQPRCL